MKKILSIGTIIALLLVLPTLSRAAELKTYPDKVNVSVYKSASLTLKFNNVYQVVNSQSGTVTAIPPNTALSVKNNGTDIVISYGGATLTSSSGFDVQELNGVNKVAIFPQDTSIRSGAASSYDVVFTAKQGSSADYLDTFTNSNNENWYKVTNGSDTGWVPAQTVTLTESSPSITSTGALSNGLTYRGSFTLKKNGSNVEVINYLDMEDYLKGVVPSEMPASWPKEALKAQAIAARSYAANSMGLSSTPSSQVYRGLTGEDSRTNAAVKETEGLLAYFGVKPVMTFFYSTSGGQTANYGDVWNSYGNSYPYYTSVLDPYESSPYSNWSETFTASAILKAFGFMDSSTKLLDVTVKTTGANGEVGGVTVYTTAGNKTVEGSESTIRKAFPVDDAARYNQLNSNWFTLTIARGQSGLTAETTDGTVPIADLRGQVVQTADGQVTLADSNVSIQTADGVVSADASAGDISSVTLNGKGWGHRIGMSQYGAKGMAEHGWSAVKIIEYYFQGTTVMK